MPACASEPPAILVVGDSLSAAYGMDAEDGWVALLERRLADRGHEFRIVNASQSGATSRGARALLSRALDAHRPALVIIEIGANDGLRGLPLAQLRENLEAMIDEAQAAGAQVIVAAMRIPPNYGPAYAERFRAVYHEVTAPRDATLVTGFLEAVALDERLLQADRIHPNERAQPILLDVLWPAIERQLGAAAATVSVGSATNPQARPAASARDSGS